jgi:hypothetical protein
MKALLAVHPAYGRRYPSADEARMAFLSGKDFSTSPTGSPYLSIRDFQSNEISLEHFDGVIIMQNQPVKFRVEVTRPDMNQSEVSL